VMLFWGDALAKKRACLSACLLRCVQLFIEFWSMYLKRSFLSSIFSPHPAESFLSTGLRHSR
jgi:hypothetical protein